MTHPEKVVTPEPRRFKLLVCPDCGRCEGLDNHDEVMFCVSSESSPEPTVMQSLEVIEAAPVEAEVERLRAALSDFVARIEADEVHDPTDGAVCDICQWLYDAHEILGNTLSAERLSDGTE